MWCFFLEGRAAYTDRAARWGGFVCTMSTQRKKSPMQPLMFSWYELMSKDVPAALAFYREVFGWTTRDSGLPGAGYTQIFVGEQAIGGALALTDEMCAAGAQPTWLGYVSVPDLAAKTEELVAAGGKVLRPMVEIPGVIRFTMVADPHGAVFVMFRGLIEGKDMSAPPPGTAGGVDWHELHAGDGQAAWAFYSKLFGWQKGELAVDMGALGTYQTWTAGGQPVGGMMTKMAETPAPFWLYYVHVADLDAALERVRKHGGKVVHGPMPVPGGSTIANCLDPQGVIFAMVAPAK